MPGFDGTGPRGLGSMAGGGRGYCAVPLGNAGTAYRARNISRGAPYSPVSAQQELELLKNEFAMLQKELDRIEARISSLEVNH